MPDRITFGAVLHTVKKLLILNLCFLALMTAFRFLFFYYFANFNELRGLYHYVAQAFFLGMRFDLSVLAYINTLVTLTLLIVWGAGREGLFVAWAKALRPYYTLMFSTALVIMVADFGFYSYFKDHINVLIYGLFEDDTMALLKTIAENHRFAAFFILLVALVVVVDLASRKTSRLILRDYGDKLSDGKFWTRFSFVLLLVSCNALAARGSLRMFPLSPIYAEISSNAFINQLSVNGIFALSETIDSRSENRQGDFNIAKQYGYEGNIQAAFADFLNVPAERIATADLLANLHQRTAKNAAAERLKPNVVVIVMESMGANLLRYDSPQFDLLGALRPHFQSDYVFNNFLPAGLITIHAMESILLNLPQRPFNLSVTQSPAAYTYFPTAATRPYKKAGYETVCLYGGSLGWRGLNTFLPAQGFDRVLGEGSLPSAEKNQWGVYDEYLFDAAWKSLSDGGKPKFIFIMTTTNHPPYSVPASYKPGPLNVPGSLAKVMTSDATLARRRFITYQYGNHKLGEFMAKIKASPLGGNTIVAVTGDHNFWDIFDYSPEESFYRYSVPLYLSIPAALKPKTVDTNAFGSHMDIMPTLYSLSLSDAEYYAAGKNMLGANPVIFDAEGLVVSKEGAAFLPFAGGTAAYYRWDPSTPGLFAARKTPDGLDRLLTYYKASMTVAEYVIKNVKQTERKAKGER